MRKLFWLAYGITATAFAAAIIGDAMLLFGMLANLFAGGLQGVNAWIVHIGTEGRLAVPNRAKIYEEFGIYCTFLLLLTVASGRVLRLLHRRTARRVQNKKRPDFTSNCVQNLSFYGGN
jgi:hypothetical protein